MRSLWRAVSLVSLILPTYGISLPKLTGDYPVGTVSIELVDHDRLDPIATEPQPRSLMVSVFYPACSSDLDAYPLSHMFPPKHAAFIDQEIKLKNGTAGDIYSSARLGAPVASGEFPVLMFSHGLALSREMYTSSLQDMASRGWIVIAVSHPGDADFVEFPDGRTVTNNGSYPPSLDTRGRADLLFLVRAFSTPAIASQIPGLGAPLPMDRIGTLGHSFGGATAFQMLLNSSAVVAAANLDGTQYSALSRVGTGKPALLMDTWTHNVTCDPGREATVQNATHSSFTDYVVLKDIPEVGLPPAYKEAAGGIGGNRMLEVEVAYLDSYFGKWLKDGKGELLDDNSTSFPEVILRQ
ncbi:putative 1-alkyl-2-acetylglycerophosphocholine esterase-like protein [Cladobotryum mycophilum]|uniref:1-alkyl-2-acetylglycerophosphocholine esterase n=1 Tax=Cladobotryum mycophilum TaxID=491253 RepID=A0ABR0SGG9_9HYPO